MAARHQPRLPAAGLYPPAGHQLRLPGGAAAVQQRQPLRGQWQDSPQVHGSQVSCVPFAQRSQCLRPPQRTKVRQGAIFHKNQPSPHEPTQLMKQAIDSPRGQRLYSQRMATVEQEFANIRHT